MSRPTHLLKHEHRIIEQAMRALEGMCFRIRAGDNVPSEELSKLLDFIRNYADRHHLRKRRPIFFPRLNKSGSRIGTARWHFFAMNTKQKEDCSVIWKWRLKSIVMTPPPGAEFVSVANQYKDHLIEHMREEEAILFRLAEEMLDDRVKDALTHVFAEENAETQEWNRRYEQLAKELEKTWTGVIKRRGELPQPVAMRLPQETRAPPLAADHSWF